MTNQTKTKLSFTPGDWVITSHEPSSDNLTIASSDGITHIAEVIHSHSLRETKANARLMAAGPAMAHKLYYIAETAKYILDNPDRLVDRLEHIIEEAGAASQAATGEAQSND